jgi:hypothetical protein
MRRWLGVLVAVLVGGGCGTEAEDCHNTLSCGPPPDDTCNGVCVPFGTVSDQWSQSPFLFTQGSGPLASPPPCPGNAPTPGVVFYANPDQTNQCDMCSCKQPSGSCGLPQWMTVEDAMCPAAGAGVSFDPPAGWDGSCAANDAVAAPSTQSVVVAPLMLTEGGCIPVQAPTAKKTRDVAWNTSAYACEGIANGTCPGAGDVCSPKPPPDAGFTLCVSREGDDPPDIVPCPPGYPKPYVFYRHATDTRACSACTCGPPQGSACSSLVTLYTDDMCSAEVGAITATSSAPVCQYVPLGSPLKSKTATPPQYTPGSCQSGGGEPSGSVQPTYPFTFCCQH